MQGEHHPEACFDEVRELASEKLPMHKGGWVRTAGGAVGDFRGVPWGVVQLDRGAVVTELLELGAGGVLDVVDASRQVGLPPDAVDELPPGRRAGKLIG